ncbi:MAG: zinc ribbon domain-containing protein [Ruminococcaceae bacterium]|nr:zinc ribbon domain-containing protein [Oscillospiraceae bacterium]
MYCRNCGKEIEESVFCPYCGSGQDASNVEKGEIVPTITEDGRQIYRDSNEAYKAFKKTSAVPTAIAIFSVIACIAMMLSILVWFLAAWGLIAGRYFPLINGVSIVMSIIGFFMMDLAGFLFVPSGIFAIVWTRSLSSWIRKNNVDCRETTKNDKRWSVLKVAQLFNDDPKSKKLHLVARIIMIITFPIGCWAVGVYYVVGIVGMSSLSTYLLTIEKYSFLTEPNTWIFLYMLISIFVFFVIMVVFSMPALIMEAVLIKRANKNFEKQS